MVRPIVQKFHLSQKFQLAIVVAIIGPTMLVYGQPPPEAPGNVAFEVSSLKRSKNSAPNFTAIASGGLRFTATNASLKLLVMAAYDVNDFRVSGGPGWFNSEFYNIEAKAERPASTEQIHSMLRTLLADRFKLELHKETKDLPTYILGVGLNSKLRKNESGDEPQVRRSTGQTVFRNVPVWQLAWFIAVRVKRDVVDETGLKGNYDFELAWTPDVPPGVGSDRAPAPDLDSPSLFTALQEQLGLTLKIEKRPAEILVVDYAERPSAN